MQHTFLNPYDYLNERLASIEAIIKKVAENQTATAPQPQIMTGEQVQVKLDITRQTLARWRTQKRIPFIQVGTVIRYDFLKVLEALESRKGQNAK